jgi:hypothetical protein
MDRIKMLLWRTVYRISGYSSVGLLRKIKERLEAERDFEIGNFNSAGHCSLGGICYAAKAVMGIRAGDRWAESALWERYCSQFEPTRDECRNLTGMYLFFGQEKLTRKVERDFDRRVYDMAMFTEWYRLRIEFMDKWIDDVTSGRGKFRKCFLRK